MSTDNNQSGSAPRRARSIAPEAIAPLLDRIRAWLVHIFTMSGMAFAALAMLALINQEIAWMWLWLGIALIVDGVDGYFARRYKVKDVLPWFDGGILDIAIDYITWTFIPAIFMYTQLDLGPKPIAGILTVLVLTSSTLCYANENWKSVDYYFYGFPAAWNIVAVILYVLQPGRYANVFWVVLFILLTIVPFYWTHPFRVKRFMALNLASITVWIVSTGWLVAIFPHQPMWLMAAFWVSGGWFISTGLVRTLTGPDRPTRRRGQQPQHDRANS
ncbi:CDP-alcohol phosphatidyltransferase family protein [Trueperella pyogenes]|uniref:CDP-alcohol phosphatidyltransferase family protein n=1 Tax=Trueperella pyogenes TaxID=1661 RepID=UPI00345CBE9E